MAYAFINFMLTYDSTLQNTEWVGYSTPRKDVFDDVLASGGSFEDLLPFSDEALVRLAASCTTPIVSAIGHEKDAPLLDLVADYRASTPTDAAKRVVPDIGEEIAMIDALRDRARRTLVNRINLEATQIANFKNRPVMAIL